MSLRKSASHGGLSRNDPKQRRVLLRHIDFARAGFPQIICFEETHKRLRSDDCRSQLQKALDSGNVETLQKLCAVALSDPKLATSELVLTSKKLLRQVLHFRKVLKDGNSCLQSIPWEYPAEQVDINVGMLRTSPWGPGVWDDELVARAKIMKDADLLKLLRSVRPLNEDGSVKTRVDLHRCMRAWLTLTEAGVLSEHLSRMLLLRLCECGNAGVALGMALAEQWFLFLNSGGVQLAFAMEELWKHLWKGAQINKTSELKIVPILQGRAAGLADLSSLLRGQEREMLLKGPAAVLQSARHILEAADIGVAQQHDAADAEAARVATVLCVIPSPALLILCRQGLFSTVREHSEPAQLAAALEVCAKAVGLSLAWRPASQSKTAPATETEITGEPAETELDAFGASLAAADKQLQRIGYPKTPPRNQEQSEMKIHLSACAKEMEEQGSLQISDG